MHTIRKVSALPFMAIVILFLSAGCQKYDDGPWFSLRMRSERVANNWRIEKAIDNGNDVTGSFDKYDLDLTKDGGASLTAHYSFLGIEYDYTTKGTWHFASKDEKIVIDYENDLADATYFILKLKETELWVRQENTNLELHLTPR